MTAAGVTRTTQICAAADCPRVASPGVAVDLGELPEGRVTLKASGVDRAGNTGRPQTGATILLDRRRPGVVRNVRASRLPDNVRVSWSAASDPRPGSGLDDYRYALFDAAGHRLRVGSTSSRAVRLPTAGGARTVTVRAMDRAGLLGPAGDAVIPRAAGPGARAPSRTPGGRKRQQRPRRKPQRNRLPRQRSAAILYKGKAPAGKKKKGRGKIKGCRWTQFRTGVSGRTMRVGAKGSCAGGPRMYLATTCIYHRESVGPIDVLAKDEEIKCDKREGLRRRVSQSARGDCDKQFDDDNYEARSVMHVTPFLLGPNPDRERRLRPKCDEEPEKTRCVGDVPGRANRTFVVYLGYVRNVPRYVGITRQALSARCRQHQLDARSFLGDIRGLNRLDPLIEYAARGVEQAVIESLGAPRPIGLLENTDNPVPRTDPPYCTQVQFGRKLLREARYPQLAHRNFPRFRCP